MSAYEELIERALGAYVSELNKLADTPDAHCTWPSDWDLPEQATMRRVMGAVLAEVRRMLKTVTPEMRRAYSSTRPVDGYQSVADWLAMLRASPLEPPK
jgi:hypothetical protein